MSLQYDAMKGRSTTLHLIESHTLRYAGFIQLLSFEIIHSSLSNLRLGVDLRTDMKDGT